MRPYIDIPHETDGKVKDYAERHEDMDKSDAYVELINAGLAAKSDSN